jgi:hypothetical protein
MIIRRKSSKNIVMAYRQRVRPTRHAEEIHFFFFEILATAKTNVLVCSFYHRRRFVVQGKSLPVYDSVSLWIRFTRRVHQHRMTGETCGTVRRCNGINGVCPVTPWRRAVCFRSRLF